MTSPLISELNRANELAEQFGLDLDKFPPIKIIDGKPVGWKRRTFWGFGTRLFGKSRYVIKLPKQGGRTKFKKAYREALADSFLHELKKQKPEEYKKLLKSVDSPFYRKQRHECLREAVSFGIQYGKENTKEKLKAHRIRAKRGSLEKQTRRVAERYWGLVSKAWKPKKKKRAKH